MSFPVNTYCVYVFIAGLIISNGSLLTQLQYYIVIHLCTCVKRDCIKRVSLDDSHKCVKNILVLFTFLPCLYHLGVMLRNTEYTHSLTCVSSKLVIQSFTHHKWEICMKGFYTLHNIKSPLCLDLQIWTTTLKIRSLHSSELSTLLLILYIQYALLKTFKTLTEWMKYFITFIILQFTILQFILQ